MTWVYSQDLATLKDKVRFLSGDVDTADQQVADETITAVLSMYGDVWHSAAAICRSLAARYSREADIAMDALKKSLSQRAAAYKERGDELAAYASDPTGVLAVPVIFAGGISVAQKDDNVLNTDRVRPFFTRHMMEGSTSGYYDGLHEVTDTSTVSIEDE